MADLQWVATPWAAESTSALVAAQTMSLPLGANPEWPDTAKATMRPEDRRQTTVRPDLREGDLLNPKFGERLAVAVTSTNALLRLIAEGDDFRSEPLPHDLGAHLCLAHGGAADDEVRAVVGQEDAIEDDRRIDVAFHPVEADDFAFPHFQLSAIGFDDGVHRVGEPRKTLVTTHKHESYHIA